MEAIGLYLLKSAAWLTGFALVYLLVLRNERYFRLNRFYLLTGIVASLLFPFYTFRYTVVIPSVPTDFDFASVGELVAGGVIADEPAVPFYYWIYLAGIVAFFLRVLFQTWKIYRKLQEAGFERTGDVKLVRTPDYAASFSFFSYVFVNPSTSAHEMEEIMNHEQEHIRQRHWFDLLLVELICIVQWFNPFAWVYAHLIRQNHEYQADESALQRTVDPAVYQAALLNQLLGAPVFSLTNSFSYSLNKKRFKMMKKKIDSPFRKLKVLVVLPLAAVLFYAFALPEYQYETSETTVAVDDNKLEVKGQVVKSDGTPLAGTSVILRNSTIGTITDQEGNFLLKDMPADGELYFSFVGFKTIVRKITAQPMIVTMEVGKVGIEGVTVIGYGTPPPPPPPPPASAYDLTKDLEGPNPPMILLDKVQITKEELNQIKSDQIESVDILKGKSGTALYGEKGKNGVVLITTKAKANKETGEKSGNEEVVVVGYGKTPSGQDSTSAAVAIRSIDSANPPLIILDGIPITKAAMDQLDPETFQSISVLKEKSATAVFGERAKNGVILITTKGKAAKGTGAKSGNEEVVVVGYGQTPSGETPPPSKVAIRSTGSFDSANPPLFILDGVPITKAEMDLINPSQIASINVIKDKSATDSYGVKATNGVIIIVTKGKESNIKQLFGNYSEQMVEVMPQFPGGQQALNDFLAGVIEYPAEAVKKNIQGRVMVTFTVKSDGTVGNAKISQGIHPLLDNEAIRVVNMSPNWTPGKYKGLPVTASYTIPVQFALDGGKLDKQKVMAEMKAPPQRPDGVFVVVEEMPEFPGKELALREFIAKTIKYPADAMKDSIQGKVFVTFVVKADGSVGDAKIARGVHPSLDQEALRVVSALPTWKPGKQRGVAVNVSYTIPVQFSLKGDKNAQQIWLSPPSQKVPTQRPDGVYVVVEEMPEFPGGPLALREFIAKTVEYPADAMKDSIQGKVFVTFVVKADGTIGDSKVARGVHPSLDNEAIRVVYALPTWKPGKQGGKAVDVSYTVPIQFTLQSKNVTQTVSYVAPKINGKGEKEVFIVVEEMPEFPGGSQALRSFVAKSIRYPAEAQKEKAQGKVFVSFVVSSTGKVKNAKIERSVSPALDAEAIRVVNQLPDWKPGKQRGKAVSVEYTIPIEFKLQ